MSLQKNFKIFNILVLFRLVSHTCVHIGIVLLHRIQNPTQNLVNSQDYTWSSVSPSLLPHCCFVLLRLKVLGLLAWGLRISGNGFCCCLLSSSSFSCDMQKGQSGPHLHFSAFRLVACSSALGSSFRGGLALAALVSSFFSVTK